MRSTRRPRLAHSPVRIFYLEDRRAERDEMRRLCHNTLEHDLIYAGEEGKDSVHLLDSIKKSRADIVIADLSLNAFEISQRFDPSGLATIKKIRQQFGLSIKIMVLTGHKAFDQRAFEAGADAVLHKGISNDDLRMEIRAQASTPARTEDSGAKNGKHQPVHFDSTGVSMKGDQSTPATDKKIRIFHLEDVEVERAGIQRMCELTEEQDLIYADWADNSQSDLGAKIEASRADVAIIDLALARHASHNLDKTIETPATSGLLAIAPLRRRFGSRLRILVLTNYLNYTKEALQNGADAVKDKGASFDELRTTIRELAAGNAATGIGGLVGLEVFVAADRRHVVVTGVRGKTPELPLDPLPMAFLVYLAEERQAAGKGYVVRTKTGMKPASLGLWESIVRRLGSSRGLGADGNFLDPARWASQINEKIAPFLAQPHEQLIAGPRKRGASATYALSPDLTEVRIHWSES